MPELPEVEVVIRDLKSSNLIGLKITAIKIFYEPIIGNKMFFQKILNQRIINLERKGKYLIFFFSNELVLVGHLRMEGKLYLKHKNTDFIKHEHFVLFLENDLSLRFHDVRKFGRFLLYEKQNYLKESKLDQLALEPFDIPLEQFYKTLKNQKTVIKMSLLNQKIILGLGNIYVNEVLFLSKIHPETKSFNITLLQAEKILNHSKNILLQSIALGGTTINTFSTSGIKGAFQNKLLVYGKAKQSCVFCQNKIIKIKLCGRGTYFCFYCQPKI